jgi:hypothetical protein
MLVLHALLPTKKAFKVFIDQDLMAPLASTWCPPDHLSESMGREWLEQFAQQSSLGDVNELRSSAIPCLILLFAIGSAVLAILLFSIHGDLCQLSIGFNHRDGSLDHQQIMLHLECSHCDQLRVANAKKVVLHISCSETAHSLVCECAVEAC